jgi:hypothetical protein
VTGVQTCALPISVLIGVLALAVNAPASSAAVKPGAACKKIGQVSTSASMKFTCIKSGSKYIWSKGVKITKPKPTPVALPTTAPTPVALPTTAPTPVALPTPTSFENLYEARRGIRFTSWKRHAETIKVNKSKVGKLEIYTGPNTKAYFEDIPAAISLVSRAFPNWSEPARTIILRFKFLDVQWADTTLRQLLSPLDYEQLNNTENGRLVSNQCDEVTKNCIGAMQQTTRSGTAISVILQGVPNSDNSNPLAGKSRLNSGMLEVHEYFHAVQRIPIMGKTQVWPHAWFREGGAFWVQTATINFDDYTGHTNFLSASCFNDCLKLSQADIAEYLSTASENYVPPKFQGWLAYSLGSHVAEALVAIKGPDILVEMYSEMSKDISFAAAFKNIFGVDWNYAIPILAKTIFANLNEV